MGKKSRERMTGLTEEQRIYANRPNLNNKVDVLRLQKRINRNIKLFKGLFNKEAILMAMTKENKP